MNSSITLGMTVTFYLLGAVLLGTNLILRRGSLSVGGRLAAIGGALLHMAAIGLRCAELRRAPFASPAESLSLLAWMLVLFYLAVEWRFKLSAAGPFALGLSFLLVILGATLPSAVPLGTGSAALLASNAISLHILATVAAIGVFALAFCCGALYLVVHHLLKSKHGLRWMNRLPPLRTVESAAFTLIAVGFPLLTLGILSGLARAFAGGLGAGWPTDPKALLSYAVWGIYGVYLIARLGLNWPPVRTSYVLLVGLVLCLLLLLVPTSAHRFE